MIGIHIKVEGGALISYLQKGVPVPGKPFLTGEKNGKQFQQAVELRPHHAHIQIIIPRNKAPVSYRPQQRAVIQPVPQSVFPAFARKKGQQNRIAVLKEPQLPRRRGNRGNRVVINKQIANILQLRFKRPVFPSPAFLRDPSGDFPQTVGKIAKHHIFYMAYFTHILLVEKLIRFQGNGKA